jgi:hypothetical protein
LVFLRLKNAGYLIFKYSFFTNIFTKVYLRFPTEISLDPMKTKNINLKICLFLLTLLIVSCGGDPEPTAAEKNTELMTASGAWKLQNVLVDGTDKTSVYSGLTIQFTETAFTTTNGGVVWPASGSWSFKDDSGTVINRNDGIEIKLVEVSTSKLVLQLTWTKLTIGPGRVSSLSGSHTFTFGK